MVRVLRELISAKPEPSTANTTISIRDLLLRSALEEELEHCENRDSCGIPSVAVSDLIYCSEKFFMARKYPELKVAQNYAPLLVMGRLLHRGVEAILAEKLESVQVEVPVEKRINVDAGGLPRIVRISGRVDAIAGDTIIELKTSRADHDLPLEHHVLQLRIYMNMLQKEKGLLVYINPERICEIEVNTPITDYELQQLVLETLQNKKHPRWSWECSYCPYNILCPHKVNNQRRR